MFRHIFSLLLGLVFLSPMTLAQVNTGTISGVVRDATGAVVPGAAVAVNNRDTGISRSVVTDAQGRYHAPNLSLGNYEVQAQMAGFQTEVRSGILLNVGREAAVDFTLRVGDITQSVEVTGEAPLVDTTSAAVSGLVDTKTIRDLPLNARSFDQLVLLETGATLARRGGSLGQERTQTGSGVTISMGGARPSQNTFLLDGTDVNDNANNMPGSAAGTFLGVDTVREFRVLTSSYSAQYGRSAGGTITAVTRSGTNELHGSAFEFHRNDDFDARNFFDGDRVPPFVRNQFGFTLGGPIKQNKSFFFGSYEGLRERLGVTDFINVPNASARQGILPGRAPIEVGPAAKAMLEIYPLPNGRDFGDGTGEFSKDLSRATSQNYFTARVDHTFSAAHSVFGRYTFADSERARPQIILNNINLNDSRSQYLTLEADSVVSPTVLNALRFGFNRSVFSDALVYPEGVPAVLNFVPGVSFEIGGLVNVTGIEGLGNQRAPGRIAYTLFEGSDDLTLVRGSHSFKTGLIVKRIRLNRNAVSGNGGIYRFTGGLTSLLQGRPNQFLVGAVGGTDLNRGWRTGLFGFYLQDDIRLKPNLTLNLGVREEFMTSPNEVNGKSARWLDVMQQDGIVGNPFFETFKFNLAPRVGFAWDTRSNGRLVARGGFGLFYDQPMPTYWMAAGGLVPPFNSQAELRSPRFPDAFQSLTPANFVAGDIRGFVYTGTGYSMQYNFAIQSEFARGTALSVGYAGSQGRKLMRTGQLNMKVPVILADGRKCFNTSSGAVNPACPDGGRARRNPNAGNLRIESSDATSNYNALLVKVEKQWASGFRIQGSYTFSKVMSIAETLHGGDFAGGSEQHIMDPYDLRRERAPASFDLKHNFVTSYNYGLPSFASGAWGKFLNGWQLSGITTITSGVPFPVASLCCAGTGSTGSTIWERPDLPQGADNNPVLGGPDRYFDTGIFVLPQTGFFGTLGRNTAVGPGLVTFDFSVLKNTAITERTNLQFRAEFFNIFNRANFETPANTLFDSSGRPVGGAGRITGTSATSRQIQFGLKLVF